MIYSVQKYPGNARVSPPLQAPLVFERIKTCAAALKLGLGTRLVKNRK